MNNRNTTLIVTAIAVATVCIVGIPQLIKAYEHKQVREQIERDNGIECLASRIFLRDDLLDRSENIQDLKDWGCTLREAYSWE